MALPGTAYHTHVRLELFGGPLAVPEKDFEQAIALAPYDAGLRDQMSYRKGYQDVKSLTTYFGDLLDIDGSLAWRVHEKAVTTDERITAYQLLVAMDPRYYIDLAELFVDEKRYDEAVITYETGFREATDRVRIANSMDWLVTWYAEHDNMTRARVIADHGFEVFSYGGIDTKGKLDERTGKLDEAEKAFLAILQRYDDNAPLIGFWKRTAALRPASKRQYEPLFAKNFPMGESKVQLSDFSSAPTLGVRTTTESTLSLEHGLKKGHVIVAIDNIRCENTAQYLFIRSSYINQPLNIIVWDGVAYRQIIADVPKRKLGFDFEDLKLASP
jgi:tetratricopeptide (TPR) repeat protein